MLKKLFFSLVIVLLSGVVWISAVDARAQSDTLLDACGNATVPSYDSSSLKTEPGLYDVYVKLGRRGQRATTTLYTSTSNETCKKQKTIRANGDRWQKTGSIAVNEKNEDLNFQLYSNSFTSLPDANRPAVMLVPSKNPVCIPKIECIVTIGNQKAKIVPVGTLLNEDTLHVVKVQDPEKDTIKSVNYYVDSRYAYTTDSVKGFDLRYVPGGNHTITTAVQYSSGQQAVIQNSIDKSYVNDFQDSIYRLFSSNQVILKTILILFILTLLASIGIFTARYIHKRKVWKIAHGIIQPVIPTDISAHTGPNPVGAKESNFLHVSKHLLVACLTSSGLLLILIILNLYVVQLFRVDGQSMEKTLYTGQQMLTNKWTKTWHNMLGKEYVPERGEVIVFHKAQSQFLSDVEDKQDEFVVKRVVALPGEKVIIENGQIRVFNEENPSGFNPDKLLKTDRVIPSQDYETVELNLSAREIFVIGDNRPASIDSRFNGPIDITEIVGRVRARVLPISTWRTF